MNLLLRINVALTAAFGIAAVGVGAICHATLENNAKAEALREAGLMMDSALAMRAYTAEEIVPLLGGQMSKTFLPQSVPSYAATQNFLRLRQRHPEYAYREATLNPTNLRDRTADWESDIVEQFRNSPQLKEILGERDTPMGRSLYLARPIRVEPKCLSCHGLANAAPATLLARYGDDNGFGWQAHETVGAQVVTVPLSAATASAEHIFRDVMVSIVAILGAALAIVNAVLYLAVVRPVRRIARIADEVSLGGTASEDFPRRGSNELLELTRAFGRMRTSLSKALQMLER
ncbi:MAG TPA: DUF3365 domain-containing protein [Steroidobacteraceae bacterium]|nr:DUF3365 domain-containing protein [Steroidobacteraceae bacterium]